MISINTNNNSDRVRYNTEFNPLTYTTKDGYERLWQPSYLEVGRKCCQYPGLKGDENAILVYSALLTIRENPAYKSLILLKSMGMYHYDLPFIARLLNMNALQINGSIRKLEGLGLISVWNCVSPSIGIAINVDLRYTSNGRKRIFRVYDRIFSYPQITKKMIMLYSYYLYLNETVTIRRYRKMGYHSLALALGYPGRKIIYIVNKLEKLGLITVIKKYDPVLVIVDVNFAYEQPEEERFKIDLAIAELGAREKKEEENQDFVESALQNDLKKFETWVPTRDNNGNDPWDITMGDGETEYVNGWKSKELLRILESSDVWKKADQQAGALI